MLNLITEHIEIWTSASTHKSNTGRGRRKNSKRIEQYGIKKLRETIISLALNGCLVNNDKNKISWIQKSIGEISSLLKPGFACGKSNVVEGGYIHLRTHNIDTNGKLNFDLLIEIDPEKVDFEKAHLHKGDILFNNTNSEDLVGKTCFVDSDYDFSFSNHLTIIRLKKYYDPQYLVLYFRHYLYTGFFKNLSTRWINQAGINTKYLKEIQIKFPPLEEQHRIVAKVDELMVLCDQLEQQQNNQYETHKTLVETLLSALTNAANEKEFQKTWATITKNFDILFTTEQSIDQLKQTILQLAVMGKLVPQDPDDEPASVLLKKIAKEKSQLVKEGKIKKQKHLPPITDNEKPFELPDGWDFVRLGNITSKIGSGSTPRGGKSVYVDSGVPFIRSQNVWNQGLEMGDVVYIDDNTHQKMSNTIVLPNDILLNITGASLGRSTIYPESLEVANVSQHVTIIRPIDSYTKHFLHLCILSPYTQSLIWGRQVGMAREGLSKKVLEQFEIPIPPIEEQHRIVAKVDELLAICDEMVSKINEIQTTQVHLADTIVEQAIE